MRLLTYPEFAFQVSEAFLVFRPFSVKVHAAVFASLNYLRHNKKRNKCASAPEYYSSFLTAISRFKAAEYVLLTFSRLHLSNGRTYGMVVACLSVCNGCIVAKPRCTVDNLEGRYAVL